MHSIVYRAHGELNSTLLERVSVAFHLVKVPLGTVSASLWHAMGTPGWHSSIIYGLACVVAGMLSTFGRRNSRGRGLNPYRVP